MITVIHAYDLKNAFTMLLILRVTFQLIFIPLPSTYLIWKPWIPRAWEFKTDWWHPKQVMQALLIILLNSMGSGFRSLFCWTEARIWKWTVYKGLKHRTSSAIRHLILSVQQFLQSYVSAYMVSYKSEYLLCYFNFWKARILLYQLDGKQRLVKLPGADGKELLWSLILLKQCHGYPGTKGIFLTI